MTKVIKTDDKGLQKFTDFEDLKTLDKFKELQETDNKRFEELFHWLQDKINIAIKRETRLDGEIDKYFNRLEKYIQLLKNKDEIIEVCKRDRWYVNDDIIKNYIHRSLFDNSYLPSNTAIAQATGLSRQTVINHIKENGVNQYKADEIDKYRMLNSNAINRLYQVGIKNNDLKALKMFIDCTKFPDNKGQIINNNYIQINNTRIDNLLIERLPIEARFQIENIILENLTIKKIE